MKIAYLSLDKGVPLHGTKGASVHVRDLANALIACGNEVTILTANLGKVIAPLRAKVIEINSSDSPGEGFPYTKGGASSPWDLKVDCLHSGMLEWLRELYAAAGFDVIYERYSLWSAVGVRAAKLMRVPCLVEVNAPLIEEQSRYRKLASAPLAKAIEGEVFSQADAIIAVSERVKTYALANGATPERSFIIPNAVDLSRFHPAVQAETVEGIYGSFVLGFVGSLKPWHGIDILLEAMRRLLRSSPDYHLLIVGDGPLKGWLDSAVRTFHLEGAVTVTGAVPHERVPGLIQRMDVAVAPYPFIEDFYFSPLKLFEYMAVGKPVVASRIGQIQEVMRDGETGLLIPPGDPQALVEQIERMRWDQKLRDRLGRAAAIQARYYTWERNARQVAAIGERLLGAQRE